MCGEHWWFASYVVRAQKGVSTATVCIVVLHHNALGDVYCSKLTCMLIWVDICKDAYGYIGYKPTSGATAAEELQMHTCDTIVQQLSP